VDRDGHTSPESRNGNFRLQMRRLRTKREVLSSSDASRKARHEFHEKPARQGGFFAFLGHLLGGRPPMPDSLHRRTRFNSPKG
jgi:hypothetical protein